MNPTSQRAIRHVQAQPGPAETLAQNPAAVEPRGLEPLTPCLQSRCATNCATAPSGPGGSDLVAGLGPRVGRLGRCVFDRPTAQASAGGSGDEQRGSSS